MYSFTKPSHLTMSGAGYGEYVVNADLRLGGRRVRLAMMLMLCTITTSTRWGWDER